jgi:hypothetical protein
MTRLICSVLILISLVVIFSLYPAYAAYEVRDSKVYLNGEYLNTIPLEIVNGRAFVPVSLFQEAFGFAISWDGVNQVLLLEDTVGAGDKPFSRKHYWWAIMVNSFSLIENDPSKSELTTVSLDQIGYYDPPLMGVDDKVYVPLRLFMQIMGGDVDYNKGDINFNLPKEVVDDINHRLSNSNATGGDFEANPALIKLLKAGLSK